MHQVMHQCLLCVDAHPRDCERRLPALRRLRGRRLRCSPGGAHVNDAANRCGRRVYDCTPRATGQQTLADHPRPDGETAARVRGSERPQSTNLADYARLIRPSVVLSEQSLRKDSAGGDWSQDIGVADSCRPSCMR